MIKLKGLWCWLEREMEEEEEEKREGVRKGRSSNYKLNIT